LIKTYKKKWTQQWRQLGKIDVDYPMHAACKKKEKDMAPGRAPEIHLCVVVNCWESTNAS
jgi:hypothetical protein